MRSLWRCCVELHIANGGHSTSHHFRSDVTDVDGSVIGDPKRGELAVHVRDHLANAADNHGEAIFPRAVTDDQCWRDATEHSGLRSKCNETIAA